MAERIMDGGDIFIEVLNSHNVDYIISSPGSEWPPMYEALARRHAEGEKAPAYLNCRHESLAVGAAAGYHRATGKLPAVTLHTSSGSLNCATNLRGALHDGTPMLVVAGESIGFGDMDGSDPGYQWLHGLSDIGGPTRLVEPFVKWSATVRTPVTLADTFHRACQIAMASPRGPAFVNPPLELMLEKIPVERIPGLPEREAVPQADSATLEQVARLLMEARSPAVFTSAAGRDPEAVGLLVQLAEMLALSVVEAGGADCTNFPTDHPLHQGYETGPFLAGSDVIFLLASAVPWHPPSKGPGPDCKVIDFSPDPHRALRPYSGFPCDVSVQGEILPNLRALVQIVTDLKGNSSAADARYSERADKLREDHRRMRTQVRDEALAAQDTTPIHPSWMSHAFNEAVPDDAVVVSELITHRGVLDRYLERPSSRTYMRSFGGLGQGLPNALGMKLAMPDRLVVCPIGDGSFNYNPVVSCFGLCQEYGMPILAVIFNNHGYASQQNGLEKLYPDGFAHRHGERIATTITPRPDYPKLVEAFGGWGQAVDHPAEIVPAIQRGIEAVAQGKPALVDVSLAW